MTPAPKPYHKTMDDYDKFLRAKSEAEDPKVNIVAYDTSQKMRRVSDRFKSLEADLADINRTRYTMMAASLLTELAKLFISRLGTKGDGTKGSTPNKGHDSSRYEKAMKAAINEWDQVKVPKDKNLASIPERYQLTDRHKNFISNEYSQLCKERNEAAHERFPAFARLLLRHRPHLLSLWTPIFYYVFQKSIEEMADQDVNKEEEERYAKYMS